MLLVGPPGLMVSTLFAAMNASSAAWTVLYSELHACTDELVVSPRSHCRSCGRVLNFVDLIPVGGYLIRRGRCASCGSPIGQSSPVVEGLSGALMLIPLATLGLGWGAVVGGVAVALLGAAAVTVAFARVQQPAKRGSRLG